MNDCQEKDTIKMSKEDEDETTEVSPIAAHKHFSVEWWFWVVVGLACGVILTMIIFELYNDKDDDTSQMPYPSAEVVKDALLQYDDFALSEAEVDTIIDWIKLGNYMKPVPDVEGEYDTYVIVDYGGDDWISRWSFYVTTPTETITFTLYWGYLSEAWKVSNFVWPNRHLYMDAYGTSATC